MLPGMVKFCIEGRGVLHADGALVLVEEQVPGLLPPSCWTTVDRLSRYASSGVGRWPKWSSLIAFVPAVGVYINDAGSVVAGKNIG